MQLNMSESGQVVSRPASANAEDEVVEPRRWATGYTKKGAPHWQEYHTFFHGTAASAVPNMLSEGPVGSLRPGDVSRQDTHDRGIAKAKADKKYKKTGKWEEMKIENRKLKT